jgi:hypothetical protein
MAKKRGRPKGAGNLKYRDADHQSKLEMARLQLADPELTDHAAANRVAPQAAGYAGDGDLGTTARRLYDQYREPGVKKHYMDLARGETKPPPPPPQPMSIVEMAQQIERTWKPILDDANRAVRAYDALLPKLPKDFS